MDNFIIDKKTPESGASVGGWPCGCGARAPLCS